MHNPAPVLENVTHKLLLDFDMETCLLISARRPNLLIIEKKKELAKLWTLLSRLIKKMKLKKEKIRISTSTLLGYWKKHEGDNYTNNDWCSHPKIIKKTGRLGGWRMSGDHPNYSIIENGHNTEKSPGDLKRLAVTQTPVKNHQLKVMWKTLKE